MGRRGKCWILSLTVAMIMLSALRPRSRREFSGLSAAGADARQGTRKSKLWRGASANRMWRLLLAVLANVSLVAAFVFVWIQYDKAMPVFASSPEAGQVYLYFDQPDVSASMVMRVTPHRPTGEPESWADDLFITLEADGKYADSPLIFTLVLRGSARPEMKLPTGADLGLDMTGCPLGMVSGDVIGCRDSTAELVEIGGDDLATNAERDPALVVRGSMRSSGLDKQIAQITVWTADTSIVESGGTQFFRLPDAGTTYLPDTLRSEMALKTGADNLSYPPILTTAVTYIELEESDRLEGVDPDPLSRSPLTWVESSASSVEATGSIVDMGKERASERWLFLYGVIAGALVGLSVPILRLWAWAIGRRR